MQARSVSLGAMFAWIPATFAWFKHRFGTLMGASALTLLLGIALAAPMYAVMFASMPAMGRGVPGAAPVVPAEMTMFWVAYAATMLVALLVFPPLMAGWFRLARDVDGGSAASATQILHPYRDGALWGRTLAFALLAFLVYLVVIGLFAAAFYGAIVEFIAQTQAQQAAIAAGQRPEPYFPVALMFGYLLFLPVMVVLQFVYMLGFAEVSLRPTAPLTALRAAFGGVARNLGKLVLLLLVVGMGLSIVMMVVVLLLVLVMAVLSLVSPVLGAVAMLALYLPFVLLMYPLMFGGHYFMWKDMLGDDDNSAAVALA